MDLVKLKALMDSDPANAGRTPAEVIAWGEEGSGEFRPRHIIVPDVLAAMGSASGYAFINKLKGLNDAFLHYMLPWMEPIGGGRGLNVGDPEFRAYLSGTVGQNSITQEEVDAVLGLATEKTRFEASGVSGANEGDVEAAGRL